MTEQAPPLDAPVVLDEAMTAKIFSTENMKAFLRLLLPSLQGGRRVLAYVLPASGRFAHMALEPWALLNLFSDDFDEIVVVIHEHRILPYSKGMHLAASEVVHFVETDQELIMLMGHYNENPSINGPLRLQIQSAPALLGDLWRHARAGRPVKHLKLPATLDEKGTRFLAEVGVAPDDKFVTLHMREGTYLTSHRYHSYRNMTPAHYEPAVRHLLDQGIWVFRLGDANSTAMGIDHPRFIDLPFRAGYEDFMDVVLLAKAWFAICCPSGPDGPARAFGTPMLLVNGVMEQLSILNPRDVVQFKRYVDEVTGRPIPYPDFLERGVNGLSVAQQFEERQVVLEENSAVEILNAVKEMEARVAGSFTPDPEIDRRFRATNDDFARRLQSGDAGPNQAEPINPNFGMALPWTNVCQAYCNANPWFLGTTG